MSKRHARYVQDMREMCPERSRDASVQAQSLAIKLQQDLNNFHALFTRCGMRQNTCETCANVTLHLSCTVV